ncbi:hypothetical protein H671_6g15624 [Cricetulus griseus]|nr:hypothetical protein H671_6g15624 [Cricetulus griseus]
MLLNTEPSLQPLILCVFYLGAYLGLLLRWLNKLHFMPGIPLGTHQSFVSDSSPWKDCPLLQPFTSPETLTSPTWSGYPTRTRPTRIPRLINPALPV